MHRSTPAHTFVLLAALSLPSLGAAQTTPTFTPVSVSGFDVDIVAEAVPAANTTTHSVDGAGHVLYAQGYSNVLPTRGLPASGALAQGGRQYQLQPYSAANSLRLNFNTGKTLVLSTPQRFSAISLLALAGDGNASVRVRLEFTDGTSAEAPFVVQDWYSTSGSTFAGYDRTQVATDAIDGSSYAPILHWIDVPLGAADQLRYLRSVTLTQQSTPGARPFVMAVSGTAAAPLPPAPVPGPGPSALAVLGMVIALAAYRMRRNGA